MKELEEFLNYLFEFVLKNYLIIMSLPFIINWFETPLNSILNLDENLDTHNMIKPLLYIIFTNI